MRQTILASVVATTVAVVIVSFLQGSVAQADAPQQFMSCTVLKARAHPQLGPKWGRGFVGTTEIPRGWSVISAVGDAQPGILVCQ